MVGTSNFHRNMAWIPLCLHLHCGEHFHSMHPGSGWIERFGPERIEFT